MSRVRINKGRFVPLPIRLAGTVSVSILIIDLVPTVPETMAIPLAILLSMIIPGLWFSFRVLTIDTDQKSIVRSVWLLGITFDKRTAFENLGSIEIRSEALPGRSNASPGEKVHKAFLHYDREEVLLLSRKNAQAIREKTDEITLKLNLTSQA